MVKFLDLQSQYQKIKNEVNQAVLKVMEKGAFVGGEFVQKFETEFGASIGSRYALGVGNGTDAIELALRALELPRESEVILPINTFFGSLEGVVNAGLNPVFVDCGLDYCMDIDKLEKVITPKTSAIMPVHLYGRACDMEAILQIAQKYSLRVIEDCAQSFGAKINVFGEEKYTGSIGDVGCFSFYPGKNLGAYGDGGAITTSDAEVYKMAQSLANHGRGQSKYEHLQIGRNSRLDGIQAAILSVKLKYIQAWNERRRECAKLYNEHLGGLGDCLVLPVMDEWERSVWHLYVVRLGEGIVREEFISFMQERGIECGIHYPYPLDNGDGFLAKRWSERIVSLPMGEHLGDSEVLEVICAIKDFLIKNRFC